MTHIRPPGTQRPHRTDFPLPADSMTTSEGRRPSALDGRGWCFVGVLELYARRDQHRANEPRSDSMPMAMKRRVVWGCTGYPSSVARGPSECRPGPYRVAIACGASMPRPCVRIRQRLRRSRQLPGPDLSRSPGPRQTPASQPVGAGHRCRRGRRPAGPGFPRSPGPRQNPASPPAGTGRWRHRRRRSSGPGLRHHPGPRRVRVSPPVGAGHRCRRGQRPAWARASAPSRSPASSRISAS